MPRCCCGAVQIVRALAIDAPPQARQGRTREAIRFAVTVTATNSLGDPYESYESMNLILRVTNSTNSVVSQARYDLFFANGIATTTVEVRLATEGQNGEVSLQVARDSAIAIATVTLIAAAESLAALRIEAPAIVHQPQLDATVEFAVTVSALGTLGDAFDPQNLQLQVSAGDNTTPNQTLLPLAFSGGTAITTVTAGLLMQGVDGRVELAVISSTDSVEARASVLLRAVQIIDPRIIDVAGDNRLTVTDIIIALRWLHAGKPDMLGDDLFINLPITAAQLRPERFTSLQMLFTVQRAGENADVNSDGVADQFDLRLILRYLSGLRGSFLNDTDTLNRILVVLGRGDEIPSLNRVTVALISSTATLIQIDPRLPVQFQLSVKGLDQYGNAIGYTTLSLSIAGSTTDVLFAWQPEILTAEASGSLVTVFVLPTQNTTLTVGVTGLPEGASGNQLLLRIQADTTLTPTIDLTGDDRVTETDIIVALNWLNAGKPDMLSDDLFINLPITAAQITTAGFTNLQILFMVQRAGENADVNIDGRGDQTDLILILRYLSGLRGPFLGNTAMMNRILLLVGRDQDLQLPAALRLRQ